MSDAHKAVMDAIWDSVILAESDIDTIVDLAITAAEPHLRRKHRQELLDELITATHEEFNWCQECGGPVEWLITLKNKESE